MAARYSGRKNLAGFELLNEPAEMYGGEIAHVTGLYNATHATNDGAFSCILD